ncbi:hypothetical protein VVMO6_02409 [Vibrio vulnificus MO6-24/O]|nr:hypothetical protein VVMO6_02409 [Vibrio vulnificus MO6-24/O]
MLMGSCVDFTKPFSCRAVNQQWGCVQLKKHLDHHVPKAFGT